MLALALRSNYKIAATRAKSTCADWERRREWDRLPIITPDIQEPLYNTIAHECQQMECTVIAIGGLADHVHLLTGFPSSIAIANLVKQVKGSSSHWVNFHKKPADFFKWQGSYAAFTIHQQDLDPVTAYIQNQANHHQQKTDIPAGEIPSIK